RHLAPPHLRPTFPCRPGKIPHRPNPLLPPRNRGRIRLIAEWTRPKRPTCPTSSRYQTPFGNALRSEIPFRTEGASAGQLSASIFLFQFPHPISPPPNRPPPTRNKQKERPRLQDRPSHHAGPQALSRKR